MVALVDGLEIMAQNSIRSLMKERRTQSFAVHETEPVPVRAHDEQFDMGMRCKGEDPIRALECSVE